MVKSFRISKAAKATMQMKYKLGAIEQTICSFTVALREMLVCSKL